MQNDKQRKSRAALWSRAPFLLTVLFVALAIVSFPPAVPRHLDGAGYEADSSLSLVLSHARANNLQFGVDHTYTYGPLGFLTFITFSPQYAGLHVLCDILLALTASAGLCLLAWRLPVAWRLLLLGSFTWIAANTHPRTDLIIDTALLSLGLLCFVGTGRRLVVCVLALTLLAAFAALAKNSFLFVATLTVMFIAAGLWLRGERRLGFAMLAGFACAFLGGWILAGQSPGNLGSFFKNAIVMVDGYNGALGWEEPLAAGVTGRWMGVLLLVLVVTGTLSYAPGRFVWLQRVVLFGWLFGLGFAAWKHGFVRAYTGNIQMFYGLVTVMAVGLQILPRDEQRRHSARWVRGLGVACCLLPVLLAQWQFFQPIHKAIAAPFALAWQNVRIVLGPGAHLERMNAIMEENRLGAQLPQLRRIIGNATVDVFGRRQAYALVNNLNYHPRPLPQSYAVGNAELMRLNEQFYLSERAPEFVLFELMSLDRKFPALEDAQLLRHLLINYQFVAEESGFLLLRKKSSDPVKLVLFREVTLRPGERIDLENLGDAPLWISVEMAPTWIARVRQFLLRPPPVRVSAWNNDELLMRGRAPASMLSGGFLASPLLEKTADIRALYSGEPIARPTAYAVEPSTPEFWGRIHVRIFRIENPLPTSGDAASLNDHSFTVFRATRWRMDQPPPGNLQEQVAFVVILLLLPALAGLLVVFARRMIRTRAPAGWRQLLAGNALVLLLLMSLALAAGEIYFRFVYDTTDSLGYMRVSEKWVQRHWHLNNAGCRDNVDYTLRAAAGRERITFIGDSFTAGHGIKDVENRFPNRLRRAHPTWEVHVLANVGLDTGSELVILNRTISKGYQLNHVVLVYCLNDIGDLLPQGGLDTAQLAASAANESWVLRNSYCLNFLYHRYKAALNAYARNYFPLVRSGYSGAKWEEQKQRLKDIRDVVHANGGRLSVVTFPFLHALGADYEYAFVHQNLDQFWRELDVPHLDLLQVYKGIPPEKLTVNPYDAHPNEYACELAAGALRSFLKP